MKHSSRYNAMAQNDYLDLFGIMHPENKERVYPCRSCGRDTRLVRDRVLYCYMCSRGFLHPRYNFILDKIV
jgi:hypothetical protein